MNNTTNSWEGFDELVRDFTSQGFMAKSEARRRFGEIIATARKEAEYRAGEKDKELIEAYKEYIALLEAMEGTVAGFMAAHGWEQIGTDEQVARGKELREKIAALFQMDTKIDKSTK
jgi:polyhydroxyalkanoate synthesis regulator phasin